MKQVARYGIAALLLVAGMAGAGLYLVFDIAQLGMKFEASEGKSRSDEVAVKLFSKADFSRLGQEDDVWMDGELCDIVSYREAGDSVWVTYYHDRHEESLVRSIGDTFEPEYCPAPVHGQHLLKHKVHLPDSEKLAASKLIIPVLPDFSTLLPSSRFLVYYTLSNAGKPAPPPKA